MNSQLSTSDLTKRMKGAQHYGAAEGRETGCGPEENRMQGRLNTKSVIHPRAGRAKTAAGPFYKQRTVAERWGMFRIMIEPELPTAREEDDGFTVTPWRGRHDFKIPRKWQRTPSKPKVEVDQNAKPGEIRLKKWMVDECKRIGRSLSVVYKRLKRGEYPHVHTRAINKSVVFVTVDKQSIYEPVVNVSLAGEVRLKTWLVDESARLGIGISGVFMRLKRGAYPNVHVRHENRAVAFVRVDPQTAMPEVPE